MHRYFCSIFTIFGFSRRIFLKPPIPNFTEIRPMAAALIHSDIWTDMAKVTRALCENDGPRGDFKIIYFIASVLCRIIQVFFFHGQVTTMQLLESISIKFSFYKKLFFFHGCLKIILKHLKNQ